MSSVEFVAKSAKRYIQYRIIKAVTPFVAVPLLLLFGVKAVVIAAVVIFVGCVLCIAAIYLYDLFLYGF